MKTNGSLFPRSALAIAVAVMAAAPALAQNTTAAIGGRVASPDGKPVAGATVVVLHRESGSVNTLTTDADGRYSARGLRVGGPYTVTVSKGGDKSVNDEVYLALAETTLVDLRLGSAQVQLEQVVVTGSAANSKFNSSTAGAVTNLSRRDLDANASIQRSLQDYARFDPRVSQTDKERGEISVAGQNSRFNSITIDGVKTNDTFGLEANNLPTRKQPISIDAIESVQINISNYDVTQQGYTGGNINAVTKSGTNNLKGSLYYVYRDDSGAGDRFDRVNGTYFTPLPFKEDTIGFTLGGPILKDKLFFFASYEQLKSNRVQPEFGVAGSSLNNTAITQAAVDQAISIARNRYSFDAGTLNAPSNLDVKDAVLKLDWNISESHRANVRFARTEQSDTNNGSFTGGFNATSLSLGSNLWQQVKTIDTVVAQLFSDWTEDFSTEFKVSQRDYNSVPQNASNLPSIGLRFSGPAPVEARGTVNTGNRFLNFGTERSRHFNVLDTKTFDLYAAGNLFLGSHELKFGADYSSNEIYNAFFQDTKGNYTFGCENGDYPFGPNGAPVAVNCSSANSITIERAVLHNFSIGRPSSYQVQLPVVGGSLEAGIARFKINNVGLFLQDTWKVSNKLTVTPGVRLDKIGFNTAPGFNAAAAAPTVVGSSTGGNAGVVRNTGGFGRSNSVTPDGLDLVQPRLSFNYQFDQVERRKSQVRGGLGLFQGAAATVWLSNPFSNTGLATRVVGCGNTPFTACTATGGVFNADPNNQPLPTGNSPASNVDFLANGLNQPSVWKLNLAFDTELPMGFQAGVELLHTRTKSGIYYEHLNLGAPTRTGAADGRQLFYTPGAYDPSCWNATGGLITSGGVCANNRSRALSNASFANVLLAKETDLGRGNTLTLSIGQPRIGDFAWQLAYSRASATEVSPLTSSVSNSNFNARSVFNPNEEVAANSAYLVRDRVSANLTWSKALFSSKHKTTFGMFYEGRAGKPYSWTFRNDMNGDGVAGNDLMYVPSGPGAAGVVFVGNTINGRTAEQRFWDVVDSDPALRKAKGGVVGRNDAYSKFANSIDFRVSQELPGFTSGHKAVVALDVLNFGNMVNKRWGRVDEMAFNNGGGGQRRTFVNFGGIDSSGRYVYNVANSVDDLTTRQASGESQWAIQITARYEF